MTLPSILFAVVSVYTIPSGVTYTLQANDPHIGAETVVDVEAGGVLNMNGLTAAFAGVTGAGVVTNGTATLSLAGGPYQFDGLFCGTLQFAQGTTSDQAFGFIVGGTNTLAGATVVEPSTAAHPLRFADGVSPFNCGSLVCAFGPTLRVQSVSRKPVKFVTGLVNSDYLSVAGRGTVHIAAGAGNTITLKNKSLSGLTGQIGAASGTLKLDATLDVSKIGGYYVQTDATLYFKDGLGSEVLDVPLSSDGGGIVYFRRPMEITGTTVRLTRLYVQDDCTSIAMKDSMICAGAVYAQSAIVWNALTNEVTVSGFGGLRAGRYRPYIKWYEISNLGYTPGYFWDFATSLGYNYTSMANQNKLAITLKDGGSYAVNRWMPAASVTVLEGGHLRIGTGVAGSNRVLIDGGCLDMTSGDHYTGFSSANSDGEFPVHVGAGGATVRGFGYSGTSSDNRLWMTYNNRFLSAGGTDGGVRFAGYASTLKYPIGFNGPLRADGLVYFHKDIVGHCEDGDSPDVANDVVIANGCIANGYDGRDLKLASGTGKKVTLDGSATLRANASQAYVLGPSGAATGAALQRNRGSALFFLRKETTALDGSDARLLVNGGLANDASAGIVKGPFFTVIKASNNGTRADFARYDTAKGLVAFTGYASTVDAGENAVAWISGKNVTMSSTSARVRGLVIDSSQAGSNNDTFIIPAGSTLHVGNGTDPACVIMNGNGNGTDARIVGDGTLDFGTSEGVIVCHRTYTYNYFSAIRAKIGGSNGLSVVTPCDGPNWSSPNGLILYNANNDYTGGTYVNGATLEVKVNGALSTGDVYLGRGLDSSGALVISGSCTEITNALHFSGWGNLSTESYATPALKFGRVATNSGPIEISQTVRFGYSSSTGTLANVIYGTGKLQLWNGRFRFQGKNTYSGGTLIAANSFIALDGDDVGFGTGPVIMDPGVIDLCGKRHTISVLRGTGRIINSADTRAILTLEKGLDLAAGELSGKLKIIVKGGFVRIGADVTLGSDIAFELADGVSIDWCGKARPIRQLVGSSLNGTYTETHPVGGLTVYIF